MSSQNEFFKYDSCKKNTKKMLRGGDYRDLGDLGGVVSETNSLSNVEF